MSRKFSHWARLAPAAVAAAAIAMSGNGNGGVSTDEEARVSVVQASEIQKLLAADTAAAQIPTVTAAEETAGQTETDEDEGKAETGDSAAKTISEEGAASDTEASSDGETASDAEESSDAKAASDAEESSDMKTVSDKEAASGEASADTETSAKKKTIVKGSHTRPTTAAAATSSVQGQGTTSTPVTQIPTGGYLDGTYSGSGTGFGGTISVSVTVSGGSIASINITSAAGETAEYLSRAKGVVSSILSSQNPNVDAVSGATYSSNGIIQAVQNALSQAANNSTENENANTENSNSEPVMTEEELEEMLAILTTGYTTVSDGYVDGTYTGSAKGYGGTVTVTVVISGGEITSITAENEDTAEFWTKAWETIQPQILQKQTTDGVDTVSGATYSSSGILNAAKKALEKAAGNGSEEEPTPEPTATPKPTATPEPTATPKPTATPEPTTPPASEMTETPTEEQTTAPGTETPTEEQTTAPGTETPTEEQTTAPGTETPTVETTAEPTTETPATEPAALPYRDGTYTGSAYGFDDDVPVTVTVTISGGAITGLTQTNNDWADYFDGAWATISSAILANQSTDGVDTVTGATWSSQGILDAAAAALAQAKQ